MKPFKLLTIFIFATLILFSLPFVPSVFAHPEEFHTDEAEVTSSASSSSSSKSQSSKSSSSQGELCQNDNGCPISGSSNLPSFNSEVKSEASVSNVVSNIIKFIIYILAGLVALAFIPLTITGIVLLANKKSKFWSIFCLVFSPVAFVVLIIIFTIVSIIQQANLN